MNDTDKRIHSLNALGLGAAQIARKIGKPGPDGEARVRRVLTSHVDRVAARYEKAAELIRERERKKQ